MDARTLSPHDETSLGAGPRVRLIPHADASCAAVRSLEVRVQALRPDVMGVAFTLLGDLRAIRIAPPASGTRADELWRHTCFEVFVRCDEVPGYLEFNFSPSGAWQAYRFSGYRQERAPAELPSPPHVTVGYRERAADPAEPAPRTDDALALEALIPLPAPYAGTSRALDLALSAVVESETGGLSYWALRHAPGRADFHHPDAFALALPRD